LPAKRALSSVRSNVGRCRSDSATGLFGPAAELTSRCPHCATEVEVVVADVARIFDEASAPSPSRPRLQGLQLRAVTSEDLAAAEAAASQGRDLRAVIVERIATVAEGETVPDLDPSTLDARWPMAGARRTHSP
jgi:hypothetical protein